MILSSVTKEKCAFFPYSFFKSLKGDHISTNPFHVNGIIIARRGYLDNSFVELAFFIIDMNKRFHIKVSYSYI